jgi:hypothetical protein
MLTPASTHQMLCAEVLGEFELGVEFAITANG